MHSRCTERCACHEISTNGSRGQWRPCPGGSVTAPATKSALQVHRVLRLPHKRQPRPSGDHTRRSWLCVLRLRNFGLQVHRLLCLPHKTARAATGPGGSVYCLPRNLHSRCTERCACHEISLPGSPSAVPASGPAATTRAAAGPGGSVYCACHEICTPGAQSAAPATKAAAAAQRRPRAPQLLREALCTATARKPALQVHRVLCLPHKRQWCLMSGVR